MVAHSLTLEHGTYETRADLVAAVKTSFDAIVGLDDDLTVKVNPADQLEFTTKREGSAATLQVTGGTALSVLGLSTAAVAATGTDGIVSVNGVDTTITNTDAGTVVTLGAGTGSIDATLTGGVRAGTADVEQISFGNGTLAEVVTAINSAGDRDVSAAIVQVAEGQYRLQLQATETGAASSIGLDLAQFTGLASGFTTLSNGQDAEIQIEGVTPYTVSSATDTFDDLLPGVDVTLTGVPTDTVTIDVTRNSATSPTESPVDALNNVVDGLKQSTVYDSENNQAALLTGNSTVRRALDELTSSVINPVAGSTLGAVSLTGLTITNDGTFEFDKSIFTAAYEADPEAVERVFATPLDGSDDGIATPTSSTKSRTQQPSRTGYLHNAEDAENATAASTISPTRSPPGTDASKCSNPSPHVRQSRNQPCPTPSPEHLARRPDRQPRPASCSRLNLNSRTHAPRPTDPEVPHRRQDCVARTTHRAPLRTPRPRPRRSPRCGRGGKQNAATQRCCTPKRSSKNSPTP